MKDGKSLRLHCRHFSNTKQARGSKESREGDVIKHRVRHVRPLQSAPKVAPSTIERSQSVGIIDVFHCIEFLCSFEDFKMYLCPRFFEFQFLLSQTVKLRRI